MLGKLPEDESIFIIADPAAWDFFSVTSISQSSCTPKINPAQKASPAPTAFLIFFFLNFGRLRVINIFSRNI